MNRHFFKKAIQISNKHMKRYTSLISKQVQIKTTISYHVIPSTRMAIIIKIKEKTDAGEDIENMEPSYTAGGTVK